MIQTRPRPAAPDGLVKHQTKWTQRWQQICDQASKRPWATKLAIRLIREHLAPMSHGKCFYCESMLERTSRAEIEHRLPKSTVIAEAFAWDNLSLSCSICNQSKSASPLGNFLVRPDVEDPECFFWLGFEGKLEPHPLLNQENRQRAQQTIQAYQLNRSALCEVRTQLRSRINRWMQRATLEDSPEIEEEVLELIAPKSEYKLVFRFLLSEADLLDLLERDRIEFMA
jgi:uncharacterized protein (TIGR02646 family)